MTGQGRSSTPTERAKMQVVRQGARKLHNCSVCGTWGEWTEDWSWYGSMRDYDERPERLVITCSPLCRYDAKQVGHDGSAGLSGPFKPGRTS